MLYTVKDITALSASQVARMPGKGVQIVDDIALFDVNRLDGFLIDMIQNSTTMSVETSADSDTHLLMQSVSLRGRVRDACLFELLEKKLQTAPDLVFIIRTVEDVTYLLGDDTLPSVQIKTEQRFDDIANAQNGPWIELSLKKERALRMAYTS